MTCLTLVQVGHDTEILLLEREIATTFQPLKQDLQRSHLLVCIVSGEKIRHEQSCRSLATVLDDSFRVTDPVTAVGRLLRQAKTPLALESTFIAAQAAYETKIAANRTLVRYHRLKSDNWPPTLRFDLLLTGILIVALGVSMKIGRALGDILPPRKKKESAATPNSSSPHPAVPSPAPADATASLPAGAEQAGFAALTQDLFLAKAVMFNRRKRALQAASLRQIRAGRHGARQFRPHVKK